MSKVQSEHGNFKTRAPWFKCFPTDWREGTRMLSAEHRGIYMDCLCLIYERDAPLPADDKWMAHALHVSARAWRSSRLALLKAGKLTFLQDGWSNSRADEERMKRRSTADQNAIIARSREDQKREKSKNGNENNKAPPQIVPRNEHHAGAFQTSEARESEKDSKSSAVSAAAQPSANPKLLYDRLISAANGALDNPVNCQGLLNTAVPQMWIEGGADLDRDVIPTLEAAGKRYCGKRIRDWSYFTGMVAETKAKRERGLPEVAQPEQQSQFEDWRAKKRREDKEFFDRVLGGLAS